ncbi:DUF4411 family protein [Caldanaerobacter sp.]|uniref:DUF4411 family protein n=1 Tax=Caldanaerobacter sp. TaxID=2930036 RepID=UPI003C73FB14
MIENNIYVLDANVFIEASRRYYAFDIAPAFWEALVKNAEKGYIITIDHVKQELEKGNDTLSHWMKNTFHHWCKSTSENDVISIYENVIKWVQAQNQFSDKAKYDFAGGADGWLIAYAKAKGCVVVTHEEFKSDIKRKVPIPNVCRAFNVPYINTFEMLRSLGIKFI